VLVRLLIAVLTVITIYGFFHERLFAQQMWADEGVSGFLAYAGVYWAAAGLILWRWPRGFAWTAGIAALGYAAWWSGPLAPFAVLYFLGSCYSLGRLLSRTAGGVSAILVGASAWMLLLWCVLHFPVNYGWVYAAAFALPYLWHRPRVPMAFLADRKEASSIAVLLFVLGAHLLVALKPEISSDGLSMHLALPAAVADQSLWGFDHSHTIWSLMPAGGEALYTGVYLLGGEAAAKLLNFAFLAIIARLLFEAARRWGGNTAVWGAALFASTPLVQLVTGSLFVENVWAALILGAVLALVRYEDSGDAGDLSVTGALAGAAVAVKLIAVAFVVPLAVLFLLALGRRRAWQAGLAAAGVALLLAVPPYLFAYAKSGNPIFPFANAVFRSPDYASEKSFADPRYAELHPSWTAPYELTFRSARYVEGQGGAAGFQYFLLFLPAVLLARRRDQAILVTVGVAGTAIVLLGAPNLRYLYGAMPLASVVIAWLPVRAAVLCGLLVLNLWFLPASGYYDADFALFRKREATLYVASKAPVRVLIERLNHEAPGEPVAFFSTDATAGLEAAAYTDTWHHEHYWERVRNAPDAAAIAAQFRSLGIRHVIAPATRGAPFEAVKMFLSRWLDAEPGGTLGALALYRVRDAEIPVPKDTRPLASGTHDDAEPRIEYKGAWLHDKQFAEPVGQTLSYSDVAGDSLKVTFEGRAITYVYTRAANRGIGEVLVDGRLVRRLNLFAAQTGWQTSVRLGALPLGTHTFELRVTGRKDRRASGTFVDLDAIRVE
jgi:hypothetical protein